MFCFCHSIKNILEIKLYYFVPLLISTLLDNCRLGGHVFPIAETLHKLRNTYYRLPVVVDV